MKKLTLITPTSDRPDAFRLCECWMRRAIERFDGEVQWIVADDGRHPITCTMGQEYIRRQPSDTAISSFRRNLLACLERVQCEGVLFIEDDDWYASDYVCHMSRQLATGAAIVGEARAKYYNVKTRRYLHCDNTTHASLSQTAISAYLVPYLIDYISQTDTAFIDVGLWQTAAAQRSQLLHPRSTHTIGIKGLPGKVGLGIGHWLGRQFRHDWDGSVLCKWIGKPDATRYFELERTAGAPF